MNVSQELVLSLEDRDAEELVLVLQGYYRLLTGQQLVVEQDQDLSWTDDSGTTLTFMCVTYYAPYLFKQTSLL